MIALDATTRWLMERLPDRVPAGADPLLLANPSWASAAAAELARRLRAELSKEPGFKNHLEEAIDELPRALLQFSPSLDRLAVLRAEIDRATTRLRNPRAPEPLPPIWLEEASRMDVVLPVAMHNSQEGAVREQALQMLTAAHDARAAADRRLHPLWLSYRLEVLSDEPRSITAKRSAHALAAVELLPPASGRYAASEDELRAVSPIKDWGTATADAWRHGENVSSGFPLRAAVMVNLGVQSTTISSWYAELVRSLGGQIAELNVSPSVMTDEIRREIEPLIEKHRANGYRTADGYEDDHAFRAAIAQVMSSGTAKRNATAKAKEWIEQVRAQRLRLIAALDAKLAALRIAPTFWFLRELREALATMPDSIPSHIGVALQTFNVKLDVAL